MKYTLPKPYGIQTNQYKAFKPFKLATIENKTSVVFEDQAYQVLMKYTLPKPYGIQTNQYKAFKPFKLATIENKTSVAFEDQPQELGNSQPISIVATNDREIESLNIARDHLNQIHEEGTVLRSDSQRSRPFKVPKLKKASEIFGNSNTKINEMKFRFSLLIPFPFRLAVWMFCK